MLLRIAVFRMSVFSFQNFNYVILPCISISLGLSSLGFASCIKSVGLYLLTNLGSFSDNFFIHFSNLALFPSLSRTLMRWMLDLLILLHKLPKALCIFFSPDNSVLFRFSNFYCSVFKFTDTFLCPYLSTIFCFHWAFHFSDHIF